MASKGREAVAKEGYARLCFGKFPAVKILFIEVEDVAFVRTCLRLSRAGLSGLGCGGHLDLLVEGLRLRPHEVPKQSAQVLYQGTVFLCRR